MTIPEQFNKISRPKTDEPCNLLYKKAQAIFSPKDMESLIIVLRQRQELVKIFQICFPILWPRDKRGDLKSCLSLVLGEIDNNSKSSLAAKTNFSLKEELSQLGNGNDFAFHF